MGKRLRNNRSSRQFPVAGLSTLYRGPHAWQASNWLLGMLGVCESADGETSSGVSSTFPDSDTFELIWAMKDGLHTSSKRPTGSSYFRSP